MVNLVATHLNSDTYTHAQRTLWALSQVHLGDDDDHRNSVAS